MEGMAMCTDLTLSRTFEGPTLPIMIIDAFIYGSRCQVSNKCKRCQKLKLAKRPIAWDKSLHTYAYKTYVVRLSCSILVWLVC